MRDDHPIDAIRRLAPPADADEAACGAALAALAELLLDRATLHVAGQPYCFTELEVYYHGFAHLDPFTHRDAMQQQLGRWYFHRAGTSYRGGTYKGLDIAFGNADAFGGILIRGIERADGTLIDGPCLVVDHILETTEAATIDELVRRFDLAIADQPRSPLAITLASPRQRTVYATPRIGLTFKRDNTELRRRFLARPYRFLSEPARIRKGKPHLITALHRQGRSPSDIASLTATRSSIVDSYLSAFEAGRARPLATFDGALSPSELCALFGACATNDAG